MSATMDRKNIMKVRGNVQVNITVEPDFIYMSKTLFMEKKNALVIF